MATTPRFAELVTSEVELRALMGHPSVPLLATALACAEAETGDGADVALAYVLGFEIDAALGIAVNPAHYTRGWHATSSIGTLGCAATAARLLGLDVGQTRHALGIAATLASGLKENFGSMTKPFHAGHAAQNGVRAAELAREGLTASDEAIEGRQGYLAAFSGATYGAATFDGLGRRWELTASGIAVKPYPSCALTHSAIDALVELRARHRIDAMKVAAVEVGVTAVVPDVLRHARPSNGLERTFSMQYCAAAALARGPLGLADFADGPVPDVATRDLMDRVRMVVDPTLPHEREQHAWTRVTVRLAAGTTFEEKPRGAAGHPSTPLTDAELRTKFLACAAPVIGADAAEGVADQIAHLEDIPDIRALTSRLTGERD